MKRILGIDPGFAETGWGIIEAEGSRFRHIAHGFIKTVPSDTDGVRLEIIYDAVENIISEFGPSFAGVEDIFFARNKLSAIPVAQAKGVVLLVLEKRGVKASVFTPLQIKQALTGNGRAEKKQVQTMVKLLLGLSETIKPDHAADALAAAICFQNSTAIGELQ